MPRPGNPRLNSKKGFNWEPRNQARCSGGPSGDPSRHGSTALPPSVEREREGDGVGWLGGSGEEGTPRPLHSSHWVRSPQPHSQEWMSPQSPSNPALDFTDNKMEAQRG